MSETHCDVVIVGAGPGGSAAASLLAQAGLRTVVLEREQFPRFKIGESLLPGSLPVLARMGVEPGELGYLRKLGAEFLDERTGEHEYFPFEDALPGPPRYAYQVERASFDRDLADAAVRAGAQLRFGCAATGYTIEGDGVRIESTAGPVHARYFVDAGGRRSLSSRGGRDVIPIEGLGRAAAFVHFDELADDAWAELSARGDIKVLRIPEGWLWVIPLAGRRLSVGAVMRSGVVDEDLALTQIAASPLLRRLTAGARQGARQRVADYSYACTNTQGERRVAIGDAAGFLDPVFSSGVTIALTSAANMADRLVPALAAGSEADPWLMVELSRQSAVAYRSFHVIAHRFYNSRLLDNVFFAGAPDPELRAGLISILAGDVWRDDNQFQRMMLAATRRELPVVPWVE
jgi:flavin-dependent dehydrogenase